MKLLFEIHSYLIDYLHDFNYINVNYNSKLNVRKIKNQSILLGRKVFGK